MSTSPDSVASSDRPRAVTVAYWIWIACAALLLFFGVMALTASSDGMRDALIERGVDDVDGVVRLVRGWGGISAAVGIVMALLVGPVKKGDARFRRALAVLSVLFALLLILAITVGVAHFGLVLVAVALLVAAVLVFRPAADGWFTRARG